MWLLVYDEPAELDELGDPMADGDPAGPTPAWAAAIFQARTSVYHLTLYSLLSTATEAVISAPLCKENWSILSPHRLMQTLRGYCPLVSSINSCLRQLLPLRPVPVTSGKS